MPRPSDPDSGQPSLRLTRAGIIGTVGVFLVAAICVRLGFWQLERLAQRQAHNDALYERMASPPLTLRSVPRDTAGLLNRRVVVSGTYDDARTMVMVGRAHRGVPGVFVVTPLMVGDAAVLVERGWVPSPDAASIELEPFETAGERRIEGLALPLLETEETVRVQPFQRLWLRHDTEMAGQLPYDVAPFYVMMLADTTEAEPVAGSYPRRMPPPELDEGRHLSYAIQWFGFATIAIVGWLAVALKSRETRPVP